MKAPVWTPAKLALLESIKLEQLRANALVRSHQELVDLCDDELVRRRKPKPSRAQVHIRLDRGEDTVVGYHFVCQNDRGVTLNSDGTFWSGSWVVAEKHVERSLTFGAYLALHNSRIELSYRQGQIIGFRKAVRSMIAKHNEGIEFHVRLNNNAYAWTGDGAGEKGYNWAQLTSNDDTERKNA